MRRVLRYASFIAIVAIPAISIVAQSAGDPQLKSEYRKWLSEDVHWLITDQEQTAFLHLKTDEERDRFATAFWERRNPTPGSQQNPFKEEHYRRLAYANQHFAAGVPGWETDRGRVYIVHGPPDSIKTLPPAGDSYLEEDWFYRHMPGIGDGVLLRFVDECMCGAYKLKNTPAAMDWRSH